jgi:1,4-alpha-glucan branching enzyme
VISYQRNGAGQQAVVVLNMTPVPRDRYRVGLPSGGTYRVGLNSDAAEYGGSDYGQVARVATDALPQHGRAHSCVLDLPPLGAVVLLPEHG